MSQTVSRFYPSLDDAERVARRLAGEGLSRREIRVDASPAGAPPGTAKVTIESPFGWTTALIWIMDREGALAHGRDFAREYRAPMEEAAPLSEALGVPVLGGRGDMFSRALGLATLTEHGAPTGLGAIISQGAGSYKSFLGLPLLSNSSGSYKSFLGLPLLSRSSGSYKGFLGLPLLSRSGAGGNRGFFGFPLLAGGGAPYRGFLGLPLLKRDPA
jgi:hypothetical protein